jgi:hypothetical protein
LPAEGFSRVFHHPRARFKFKELVDCCVLILVVSVVLAHVCDLKPIFYFSVVVHSNVTARLGVFQAHNVTSMNFKIGQLGLVSLSIGLQLQLHKVLRNVCLTVFEHVSWISAALRGWGPELTGHGVVFQNGLDQVNRHIDKGVVLGVCQQDLVLKNDPVTFLPVLIPRLDLESNARG